MKRAHFHVTNANCELPDCDWFGYHVHWRQKRFRSISDLTPREQNELDRDCWLDLEDLG
jgi:hypothetical protein